MTVEQLEEQMRAAGIEPAYTEPSEVADQVVDGPRVRRFWILPDSDRIDDTIRARSESMLDREPTRHTSTRSPDERGAKR